MRIALAQTNPTIGDIAGNASQLRDAIIGAKERGAELVVFPELAVMGYPPKDLLLKPSVIEECAEAVADLAALCTDIAAVIGYPAVSDRPIGRTLFNAAAFCRGGAIERRFVKSLLPTYDVFDEHRYFEPGPPVELAEFQGVRLGVSICEDLWNDRELMPRQLYADNPIDRLAAAGAQVLINCSASPFVVGKHEFRLRLFASAARRHRLPLLYCNQVGGDDELIFDGNSCAVDPSGLLIAQAKDFETDLLVVDLSLAGEAGEGPGSRVWGLAEEGSGAQRSPLPDNGAVREATAGLATADPRPQTPGPPRPNETRTNTGLASAYHALVLGLRDYCRKCGFKSIVLGLSGGIDSALCAALAAAAVGPEHVRGVAMPSRFSSQGSVDDAREVASRLGIDFHVIPIQRPHEAFEAILQPHFEGRAPDATEENIQARIRGVVLMAFSNKFSSLLITTGNKSELAVGYCTLYGDMAGGLAVISDVPKTMVWELAKWINTSTDSPLLREYGRPVIPESSITKVPSAELRPNQTDQDSLPAYEVLDRIIDRYVERDQSAPQIAAALPDVDPAVILRMVKLIDLNEYKRKQAAPGLKITGRAFGFGRRMPIAQRYDASRAMEAMTVKAPR